MNKGKSVFAQLMSLFPEYKFRQFVARYNGDRHMIKFSCRDQFMVMSFALLTSQQSLRTNEASLAAFENKLYHAGLTLIPRSTLGEMNEKKDWRIYHDLAQHLIKKARKLYDKDYYRLGIEEMVYAFDSSTIELCLKLCPWADFHHDKGADALGRVFAARPPQSVLSGKRCMNCLSTADLPAGVYLLYIGNGKQRQVERITVE